MMESQNSLLGLDKNEEFGMERVQRKVDIQYGLIGLSDGQSGGLAMLWK